MGRQRTDTLVVTGNFNGFPIPVPILITQQADPNIPLSINPYNVEPPASLWNSEYIDYSIYGLSEAIVWNGPIRNLKLSDACKATGITNFFTFSTVADKPYVIRVTHIDGAEEQGPFDLQFETVPDGRLTKTTKITSSKPFHLSQQTSKTNPFHLPIHRQVAFSLSGANYDDVVLVGTNAVVALPYPNASIGTYSSVFLRNRRTENIR